MGRGSSGYEAAAIVRGRRLTEETSPANALARLQEMLSNLGGQEMLLGDSDVIENCWLETHTIGCRNAADTDPGKWWDEHYEIFDEYQADGETLILGDPAEGIFATLTPIKSP